MTVTGIIAEYNPFHLGHKYQIDMIKNLKGNDSYIVAVISGSFTQRGEPCILDKWSRAELAINNGCDLVIELPFTFSCRSAQHFARGGIRLLSNLGIITHLAFGGEASNISIIQTASNILESKENNSLLKSYLKQGFSYATSTAKSMPKILNKNYSDLLTPNNILAIEYVTAIRHFDKYINPILIERVGDNHNNSILSNSNTIASATAIRENIYSDCPAWEQLSRKMPKQVLDYLYYSKLNGLPDINTLFLLLKHTLSKPISTFTSCYGISEGLEYRFIKFIKETSSLYDFIKKVSSKRYPFSRISRLIPFIILKVTSEYIRLADLNGPLYIRPLSFNNNGKFLLKQIKKAGCLPIINQPAKILSDTKPFKYNNSSLLKEMLELDILSSNLRNLCIDNKQIRSDLKQSPIYFIA